MLFKNILLFMLLQLSLFSLCPPPSSPPTTSKISPLSIVHVHWSFIYVLWLIPSPSFNQSLLPLPSYSCQSVPWLYVSGSILLISLLCSLDSSHKWNHMVFVFHWLTCFILHKPPVPSMLLQKVGILSFFCFVVFHCIDVKFCFFFFLLYFLLYFSIAI